MALDDVDFLFEANFSTEGDNFGPHVLHHRHQLEGTDMGFADHQDLRRRTGLDKLNQHLTAQMTPVLDLAVELAVREGPRTTLAKLHVGLGLELTLAPKAPGGFTGPLPNVLPAL